MEMPVDKSTAASKNRIFLIKALYIYVKNRHTHICIYTHLFHMVTYIHIYNTHALPPAAIFKQTLGTFRRLVSARTAANASCVAAAYHSDYVMQRSLDT